MGLAVNRVVSLFARLRTLIVNQSSHLIEGAGFRIERLQPSGWQLRHADRISYQRQHVQFDVRAGDRVLDIGSGAYPFPPAAVLVDRFIADNHHRSGGSLITHGKQLIAASVERLPFRDQSFDYVYCSHILEHVDDPISACRELMRVAPRGYVETPTLAKDMLFGWAKGLHRWHVMAIGQTLCFFEYSERLVEGVRSPAWRDILFSKWWHPLQDAFEQSQDVFNVMLPWRDSFAVVVLYLDGRMQTLNVPVATSADDSTTRP
jgi:SAM-dependent methyltransferase